MNVKRTICNPKLDTKLTDLKLERESIQTDATNISMGKIVSKHEQQLQIQRAINSVPTIRIHSNNRKELAN